ncbi:MAG: hypothetical protein ACLFWM_11355 [Actinomycetota bacterium]
MRITRRLSLLVALGLVATLAVPVSAQVDDSSQGGVVRLTKTAAAVTEGTSGWVTLNWTAQGGEATSFRVTARAAREGVVVGYPENTGDHTSLYWDDILSDGEIDYTALHVSVPAGVSESVDLTLEVSYDWNGRTRTETMGLVVPVAAYEGAPLETLTDDLGEVEEGTQTWLDLWYTAPGPPVEGVAVTVQGDGAAVTYPGLGDASGLSSDPDLDTGEKDVARFRLDTAGMAPGSHTLTVTAAYALGGRSDELVHEVVVSILEGEDDDPGEEADPRKSARVVDSDGAYYWWNDSGTGGEGAWKAGVTFRNDWIRHHYLTLEVTRTRADGTTSTQTVRDFYVGSGSQSTYEAWDNSLTVDGDERRGVVEVQVRVVSIRTSDESWQTETHETDGPVVTVAAPGAG